MDQIKKIAQIIIGDNLFNRLKEYKRKYKLFSSLTYNFCVDFSFFYKHSMVFNQDTFEKIEAVIILRYHSLEKGLLHDVRRNKFGKPNVIDLCKLLKRNDVVANRKNTQIAAAYLVMCKYYDLHFENDINISEYFSKQDYDLFKKHSVLTIPSVNENKQISYFENTDKDFFHFSRSRSSVRDFNGEIIPFETINKAIEIAKTAPSVCNRQPVKVYYVDDKKTIDSIFSIQEGLKGYSDSIHQLLVVVSDRSYFYSVGERNQLYIDGGIFLMNLLYALHFYKIGACPAHWGLDSSADKEMKKLLRLDESEKVICLVPIGIPKNEFKTTLSLRRSNDEILKRFSK